MAQAGLALGLLMLLPGCAEGVLLLAWATTSLALVTVLWVGRQVLALDWNEERRLVLQEAATQLGLPAPGHGHGELHGTSPRGLAIRAHATPHLELRMALPAWVPANLVVDTVAPPLRGLRRLVPDPRFLEWVAAGPQAELLGLLTAEVREALLEAHHFGPGPGICLRRGGLEASLPWSDLGALERTIARMERIALALAALPEGLPGRLLAAVTSADTPEVRQACLRALQDNFPRDPATGAALRHAEQDPALRLPGPGVPRQELQGRLALAPASAGGALSVHED